MSKIPQAWSRHFKLYQWSTLQTFVQPDGSEPKLQKPLLKYSFAHLSPREILTSV